MRKLAHRRIVNTALLAVSVVVLLLWCRAWSLTLRPAHETTGWLALGSVVFLALYNLRKKLSLLPLLRSSTWLQAHIYVGFLCVGLFLAHIEYRVPTGSFEVALALVFALVAGSGVIGLVLTRTLPKRLARRGEEVLFERIPGYRHQLAQEARELALRSVEETRSSAIADFHDASLAEYLERPRERWSHLLGLTTSSERREHEIDEFKLCLPDDALGLMGEMEEIVSAKADLDFHHYNQGALKYWLFVHLPLTWCLLGLLAAHVFLVYSFGGVS